MPRLARFKTHIPHAVHHVVSRIAVETFFTDEEKDFLFAVIKHFSLIYFTTVYGFCVMGNHFHLIAQMHEGEDITDEEIKKRFRLYRKWCATTPKHSPETKPEDIDILRKKWSDLSEFVKDIKQCFARTYNKTRDRQGTLWGARFKSTLLEKGAPLLNCMAYVDLNPVRAGIVTVPEDYRWNSLHYHVVLRNKARWLSLDYSHPRPAKHPLHIPKTQSERFRFYRKFLYTAGIENRPKVRDGKVRPQHKLSPEVYQKAEKQDFQYTFAEAFCHRCRYFSDALILGSHAFVETLHAQHKNKLPEKRKRRFPRVKIFQEVYSMRELRSPKTNPPAA